MKRPMVVTAALFLFLLGGAAAFASGDSATYHYDSFGRLQTVTYPNGTVITYNYDSAGNRTTVVTTCSASPC